MAPKIDGARPAADEVLGTRRAEASDPLGSDSRYGAEGGTIGTSRLPRRKVDAMADTDHSEAWRELLTDRRVHWIRTVFRHLPTRSSPRCRLCFAPTAGPSAPLMRLIGRGPWKH